MSRAIQVGDIIQDKYHPHQIYEVDGLTHKKDLYRVKFYSLLVGNGRHPIPSKITKNFFELEEVRSDWTILEDYKLDHHIMTFEDEIAELYKISKISAVVIYKSVTGTNLGQSKLIVEKLVQDRRPVEDPFEIGDTVQHSDDDKANKYKIKDINYDGRFLLDLINLETKVSYSNQPADKYIKVNIAENIWS